MMIPRIPSKVIRDYLLTGLTVGPGQDVNRVGTTYEAEYVQAYPKTWPAVWVAGQKASSTTGPSFTTGQFRQKYQIDLVLRIVVQRFVAGDVGDEAEDRLDALARKVIAHMVGKKLEGTDQVLGLTSMLEGPPADSIQVVDLVFSTLVTFAGVPK